jgi:hypothetical protein
MSCRHIRESPNFVAVVAAERRSLRLSFFRISLSFRLVFLLLNDCANFRRDKIALCSPLFPLSRDFFCAAALLLSSLRLPTMFGPVFVVFNFLSIFFLLLPSSWHWKARNTATLTYIFWCLVNVVPLAINSLIWRNRFDLEAPIYCDVR